MSQRDVFPEPQHPAEKTSALGARDILDLTNAEALTVFFERLGYEPHRLVQVPEHLGIEAEAVRRPILHIERLARQGDPPFEFEIYLFELSKITLKHTRDLARAFRDRLGFFLLVLTHNWQRLDFVFVERQEPPTDGGLSTIPHRQERARVRPRILTLDRRDPKRVDLRVLRGMRWTAEDSFAQNEKILAAYGVADWSEEFFNNRALFSDHYLTHILPEDPAWKENPHPAMRRLAPLVTGAAERYSSRPTGELRAGFLTPVLEILGFRFSTAGGTTPPKSDSRKGFVLFAPDGSPVVYCIDAPWGRYLDGKDPKLDPGDPEDNPGARVVEAFGPAAGEEAFDWVILTNGQQWRLHSRRTHSRTTNYYEIDLPELLIPGTPDQALDAFRYFWLLFRCQAFEGRPARRDGRELREALVDRLLVESQEYAKALGEQLKNTVFEEVFPDLAKGFQRSVTVDQEDPIKKLSPHA